MQIQGMIKTSLLDYPGRIAAVLFTGHCNMRCLFCHNAGLVEHPEREPVIPGDEVLSFLEKRKDLLGGVVITGGEPTLSPDLADFISHVKERTGLSVKLDTNGTRPDVVKALISNGLIDYIAMDIKSDKKGYSRISGVDVCFPDIEESIKAIINGGIHYEFRTTVVRQYYNKEVARNIGEMLKGAYLYTLQQFRMCGTVLGREKVSLDPCPKKEMLEFQQILSPYISHVELRGVD